MRSCTSMRRAGPAWLALAIVGAGGMANAAPDPRPASPATGGWTRDGWSDGVAAARAPSSTGAPVQTETTADPLGSGGIAGARATMTPVGRDATPPQATTGTSVTAAKDRPPTAQAAASVRAAPTGGWTDRGWSDAVAGSAPTVSQGRPASPPTGVQAGNGQPTATATAIVPGAGPTPSPVGGGWTSRGWADDATATSPAIAPAGAVRSVQGVVPPPAPRRLGVDAAGRRLPWDGGRGPAFRYERGQRLPTLFVEQPYRVDDWIGYGLPVPPAGARWVRYFDDAVMIDESALVFDAVPGIDWATPPAIYGPTPRIIDNATGKAAPAQADGSTTTTEIRSTPGGGRVMVTTTTTPEVATTVIEEHEVP